MKRIIFLFFVLSLVFLTSCNEEDIFKENKGDYHIKYEEGIITYSVRIQKPTPCHTLTKDEIIMESYPVQVLIDLTSEPSNNLCAQVISYETIEGEIDVGHKPSSFTIKLDNKLIYSTDLKNEWK